MTHVPLTIKHPDGKRAGEASDWFASTHDLAPTLLSMLDVDPSPRMEGADLSPLFDGRPLPAREMAYGGYYNRHYVRTDKWFYQADNHRQQAQAVQPRARSRTRNGIWPRRSPRSRASCTSGCWSRSAASRRRTTARTSPSGRAGPTGAADAPCAVDDEQLDRVLAGAQAARREHRRDQLLALVGRQVERLRDRGDLAVDGDRDVVDLARLAAGDRGDRMGRQEVALRGRRRRSRRRPAAPRAARHAARGDSELTDLPSSSWCGPIR